MLTTRELNMIEGRLFDYGLNKNAMENIHNSKICIIDDKIEDLKSMTDGLRREGFTNLTEYAKVDSVNSLIVSNFKVIILDLNDIAKDITDEDGIGVLIKLKEQEPEKR